MGNRDDDQGHQERRHVGTRVVAIGIGRSIDGRNLSPTAGDGSTVLLTPVRLPLTDGRRTWQRRGWRWLKMANEEAARPAAVSDTSAAQDREPKKKAKLLVVRVVEDGRPAVNIKVPIDLAKWGMKMAQAFSPEMKDADLDWESIIAMIQEGEGGKIVEVEDEVDYKTVEVWVQ
jgi:hypothetical protein